CARARRGARPAPPRRAPPRRRRASAALVVPRPVQGGRAPPPPAPPDVLQAGEREVETGGPLRVRRLVPPLVEHRHDRPAELVGQRELLRHVLRRGRCGRQDDRQARPLLDRAGDPPPPLPGRGVGAIDPEVEAGTLDLGDEPVDERLIAPRVAQEDMAHDTNRASADGSSGSRTGSSGSGSSSVYFQAAPVLKSTMRSSGRSTPRARSTRTAASVAAPSGAADRPSSRASACMSAIMASSVTVSAVPPLARMASSRR